MKKLLNTLYVTSEDSYLSLDGENVVIFNQTQEMGRIPLHNLEAIVSLAIGEPARHLWADVQAGIFPCAF